MAALSVDGNDVLAVRAAAVDAVARARAGAGPTFLECRTWRHSAHSEGEQPKYWDQAERAAWIDRDPIPSLARRLLEAGLAREHDLEEIASSCAQRVADAVALAEAAPFPSETEALEDVFAPSDSPPARVSA